MMLLRSGGGGTNEVLLYRALRTSHYTVAAWDPAWQWRYSYRLEEAYRSNKIPQDLRRPLHKDIVLPSMKWIRALLSLFVVSFFCDVAVS